RHELDRDYARITYAAAIPDGISGDEYSRRWELAWKADRERTARANETRSNAVAEARRDWTAAVGDLNVAMVAALVGAQQDRAEVLRSQTITLATAVGQAQRDFEIAEAAAFKTQSVALA